MLNPLLVPDPAPGDEFLITVPGGQVWTILGVQATLTTSRVENIVGFAAVDVSGNGRDGTYHGPTATGGTTGLVAGDTAVTFGPSTSGPPLQGSMQFPAADYVIAGSTTIEFWCAMDVPAVQTLLADLESSNPSVLQVRVNPDGSIVWTYTLTPGGTDTATSAAGVFNFGGAANHIVGVFKDTVVRTLLLYHDGVLVASTALTHAHPGGISLGGTIGTASHTAPAVVYDELSIYGAVLSAAQVAAHFAAASVSWFAYAAAVLGDTPRGYYHLDEQGSPTSSEVFLAIGVDGTDVFVAPALGIVGDGAPHVYTWLTGTVLGLTLPASGQTFVGLPFFDLIAGYTIGSRTLGDHASLQWSDVTLWYDFVYDYQTVLDLSYDDRWLIHAP